MAIGKLNQRTVADCYGLLMAGRPSIKTSEMIERICSDIADGKSLRAICREDWSPHMVTVLRWLDEDADFAAKYAHARVTQTEAMADELLDIADSVLEDAAAIGKAKLQIDTRRWIMSKRYPKRYGDRVEQNLSGEVNVKASVLDVIAEANKRGNVGNA